jgi:hypothetical protein
MKEWGTPEWYPVLVKGKGLIPAGDWILFQSGENVVRLIHHSGKMCQAVIEEDGVCRVRSTHDIIPLPDEVVEELVAVLNLS